MLGLGLGLLANFVSNGVGLGVFKNYVLGGGVGLVCHNAMFCLLCKQALGNLLAETLFQTAEVGQLAECRGQSYGWLSWAAA